MEDLAIQVHQLTAQINGSMEFPPEDEIKMIMKYGSVQNYQSNFQQGGFQYQRYQNNNSFGGMRDNSPMAFTR